MAITINGNGTVTGVSVGGLPDGIVDTDMLAATAVSTAKIADDAITVDKTSQLVNVNYDYEQPSPNEINIPYDTYTTLNSGYGWVLPSAGTYLLRSNSRIKLWGVPGYISCRLYDTTNSSAISDTTRMLFEQNNASAGTDYNVGIAMEWLHTCTGAVTINQQYYTNNNSTNSSFQNDVNGRPYFMWQRLV